MNITVPQCCIGLDFFSLNDMQEAIEALYQSWHLKPFSHMDSIEDAREQLIKEDTYFKTINKYESGVFIGEKQVSFNGSADGEHIYTKEEIRQQFASTMIWYIKKQKAIA